VGAPRRAPALSPSAPGGAAHPPRGFGRPYSDAVTAAPTPRALSDASGRRRILGEIVLVLGLSLGASAVYSLSLSQ